MPSLADLREQIAKQNMPTKRILHTGRDKTSSLGRHKANLAKPRIQVNNKIDVKKSRIDFALYRRITI